MAKIKKISYKDILNIKKLISVVLSDNVMSYRRLFFLSVPTTHIQNLFYGVRFRKLPETYVVFDNSDNLKGLVSVQAQNGNPYKWQLKRLFLDKNSHEEGKQLIEYVIAKFGARGVDTFYVKIDDTNDELADLLIKGCGFRYCSTESLWAVSNINFLTDAAGDKAFRPYKNSDSAKSADLYNENLTSLYKYSLTKNKDEFNQRLFQGLNYETVFKYVLEDENSDSINALIEIITRDNKNYFIDTVISPHNFELYPAVISFAIRQIMKRNKNFKLYIKNRKYLQSGELMENFYKENRFELLQNNAILVRDFFKAIREENKGFAGGIIFSGFEV